MELWRFLVNLSENKIDITKKQYAEEAESTKFKFEGKLIDWSSHKLIVLV